MKISYLYKLDLYNYINISAIYLFQKCKNIKIGTIKDLNLNLRETNGRKNC